MSLLTKLFPLSFREKSVANLVITIIIYLVAPTLVGFAVGLVNLLIGAIPVIGVLVGIVLGLVTSLIGIYCFAGIVIAILNHFNILDK
nr:hypothetical protein [Clostridia bacterium]